MKGNAHRSQSEIGPRQTVGDAQWLLFTLDSGRYALPLTMVERVVRAVAITPLPRAPAVVLGAIDLAGIILPVFDLRRRFGLPVRPLDAADQFVIARTRDRRAALLVDAAQGLIEHASPAAARQISPALAHIQGVIPLEDGMVLIHDLDHFLSSAETHDLDEAMRDVPHAR